MITMTAVILFSINPWLALVTLLPLPIIGWLIHFVREKLRTGFEKIDRVWAEVTNVLADTIPGIRVVKAFAQEKREGERFRAANEHNLQMNDKLNKTWSLFTPTVTLLTERNKGKGQKKERNVREKSKRKQRKGQRMSQSVSDLGNKEFRICLLYTSPSPRDQA
eukprot:TRINITY_DN3246_c0_g1_i1.p2 TRINITY_DN3246_c0_g1~~TRINITY_DN3246_c0_g1_i1.p2  ORF type:complete len:164 (+),score=23.50 TRINITY_DN3246_c0_g1_i1:271-762(+)